MSPLSFRFGTVGSPTSTPKKPGGSVGAVMRLAELGLHSLELGWVRAVRVTEETCAAIQGCRPGTRCQPQRARPLLHQPERR